MKKLKRLFLTALFSAIALFITCGMAFASNAIVDEGGYTHPSQFSDTIVLDGIDVSEWQADVNWEKVKKHGIDYASNAIVDEGGYTHPSQFSDTIVLDGIDVSEWQADVNWEKVKKHGIDYAYIRLGFSYLDSPFRRNLDSYFEQNYQEAKEAGVMVGVYYYSTATTISEAQKEAQFCLDVFRRNLDSYFEQNYQEAKEAGVMVGVYYYSTATTISEAQKEAQFCLDVLNGRELDLPVVFDFELDGRQGSAYNSWSSGTRRPGTRSSRSL